MIWICTFLLTICSSDYWSFYILFLCSSLLGCLLLHILDKSLLAYASDIFSFNVARFYPIFSSRNFIVLTFVVSSMIHFKFISLYDRNKGWSCFFVCLFLLMNIQLLEQHLLEGVYFLCWINKMWLVQCPPVSRVHCPSTSKQKL